MIFFQPVDIILIMIYTLLNNDLTINLYKVIRNSSEISI